VLPEVNGAGLIIFAGRFGSGKTEIALNYAARLAEARAGRGGPPILVDLDIVTPYFRTREMVVAMRSRGVEVIAPPELTRSVDVPAITPQILGAIEQTARPVVVDVGGDPQGAKALGQYRSAVQRRGYTLYFVVNPFRPYTATPEAIRDSVREIESTSHLKASSLVSNPNLMKETTSELVREGHAVVEAAARLLGLPVGFIVIWDNVLGNLTAADLPVGLPVMSLSRYFSLPWE
jgi:hypothetical protein